MATRTNPSLSYFARPRLGLRIAFLVGVVIGLLGDRPIAGDRPRLTLPAFPISTASAAER